MVKFSVVIPTFYRRQYVAEAVDSVLSQTFKDYEIIVVDDGSTDGTREVLQNYGGAVRLAASNRKGPGGARNVGVRLAEGRYLSFLDSDDRWAPQTLEVVDRVLEDTKSKMVWLTLHRSTSSEPWPVYGAIDFFVGTNPFDMNGERAPTNTWGAIDKTTFNRVGGFVEDMPLEEDTELLIRLRNLGPVAHIRNPPLLWYRVHEGQITKHVPQSLAGQVSAKARRNTPICC